MFHILKGFCCTYITYNISICYKDNQNNNGRANF